MLGSVEGTAGHPPVCRMMELVASLTPYTNVLGSESGPFTGWDLGIISVRLHVNVNRVILNMGHRLDGASPGCVMNAESSQNAVRVESVTYRISARWLLRLPF